MMDLKYMVEVNKKGQITIPKTLRDVTGIKEESFVDISYNKETNKIEIEESKNLFDEFKLNIVRFSLLSNEFEDKKPVLFISGGVGVGKTTLVKQITKGLVLDGLKGKVKEHILSDNGEVYIVDDIFEKDFTNQDKINDSKPTIITSHKTITTTDVNEEEERLYIYVFLSKKERGVIESVQLSKNGNIIEWK